jgi:hypothetical protein
VLSGPSPQLQTRIEQYRPRETREDFTRAVYPASLSPSRPMLPHAVLPRPGLMLAAPFLTHEMAMSSPAPFDRLHGRLVHQIRMLHIAQPFEFRTEGAVCSRRPAGTDVSFWATSCVCIFVKPAVAWYVGMISRAEAIRVTKALFMVVLLEKKRCGGLSADAEAAFLPVWIRTH